MDRLKIYSQSDIDNLIIYRDGETKLGEKIQTISSLEALKSSTAKFVLLGIPDDIGIRANSGIAGASTTWRPALMAFLNTQSNRFLSGEEILVLGHFEIEEPENSTIDGLRKKVSEIDDLVFPVIEKNCCSR